MAERSTISTHQIEELLDKTGSKFLLVSLAAKRSRQLNDYANGLGHGTGQTVPPQVEDIAHKPLTIAFAEIAADKIKVGEQDEAAAEDQVAKASDDDADADTDTGRSKVLDIDAELETLDIFA